MWTELRTAEDIRDAKLQPLFASCCSMAACAATVQWSSTDGQEQHIGDPTETAIVLAAHKNGMLQGAA